MSLVTVRVFDNPIDAHLLKSKLESEDVQCYLIDENIVTINPLYNQLAGGIKLQISDMDVDRVQAILSEIDQQPYLNSNDEILKCPKCSSIDLHSNFKSMKGLAGAISFIWSLLVMIYPFYYNTNYKCKKCGEEFENK